LSQTRGDVPRHRVGWVHRQEFSDRRAGDRLLLTAPRQRGLNASLARAVIVDTSASMQRRTAAGERALDVALGEARRLADSAAAAIVLRTTAPSAAIAGATAWLGRQSGRGELVMVSDFQAGTLDAADLATVPVQVGVRLVTVRGDTTTNGIRLRTGANGRAIVARLTRSADRVDVEWLQDSAPSGESHNEIALWTSPAETAAANAARAAAATIAVPLQVDSGRRIAIMYPGYPDSATLLGSAQRTLAPWMADLVVRVAADSNIDAVADNGRLVILMHEAPGSLASATLIAAVRHALSVAPPPSELDQSTIPDSLLARWQRAPAPRSTPGPDSDRSDGRWGWIAALVLLIVEWILRRSHPRPVAELANDVSA
jgi:hypothetical protein